MFDLSSLRLKDSVELQLRHPDTEELLFADPEKKKPVKILLRGRASKEYRNASFEMQNRLLKRGNKKTSAEVMREESIDFLVACSVKAENLQIDKDTPLNSPEAFKKLYSDAAYDWVKDQVDACIGDNANFLDR